MRAYTISSNDSYLKLELKYLRKVFHKRNGFPHRFITKVMNVKYTKGTFSGNKRK